MPVAPPLRRCRHLVFQTVHDLRVKVREIRHAILIELRLGLMRHRFGRRWRWRCWCVVVAAYHGVCDR
jgi:hypothetical protein